MFLTPYLPVLKSIFQANRRFLIKSHTTAEAQNPSCIRTLVRARSDRIPLDRYQKLDRIYIYLQPFFVHIPRELASSVFNVVTGTKSKSFMSPDCAMQCNGNAGDLSFVMVDMKPNVVPKQYAIHNMLHFPERLVAQPLYRQRSL